MTSSITPFDLSAPLVHGRLVLEASAGTGKTYSLTNLAVRHLVEGGVLADQLLVVTYTRAAANELRDRARAALASAYDVLGTGEVPEDHAWMSVLLAGDDRELEQRLRRAREALARFDDATITTIHGFCQQALAQAGLRSGSDPDAVLVESADDLIAEVCRDLLVDRLALDPSALSPTNKAGIPQKSPKQVETAVLAAVKALIANPAARIVPAAGCHPLGDRWVEVITSARDEVRAVRTYAARSATTDSSLICGTRWSTLERAASSLDNSPIGTQSCSSTSSRTPTGPSGRSSSAPSPVGPWSPWATRSRRSTAFVAPTCTRISPRSPRAPRRAFPSITAPTASFSVGSNGCSSARHSATPASPSLRSRRHRRRPTTRSGAVLRCDCGWSGSTTTC
jgi:hypothetical protein